MAKANVSIREQAIQDAVDDHGSKLLSIISRRIRDEREAEDIRQEVLAEFMEAYDVGTVIESIGAWLVRVAQNKIIDRFRRKRTEDEYLAETSLEIPQAEASDPESEAQRAWMRGEIADAISLLPTDQREVFVLHELEGKSFEEIARATGVGVNTLLSRKRYAVLFLREYLKEVYDGLE